MNIDEIKQVAEELKIKNGNLSQKELLWYLVHRVDAIEVKLNGKVDKSMFRWFVTTGVVILSVLLTIVGIR